MDNGLDIMRADNKSGYCIYGFDTSISLCHGEPQERKRNRVLSVNIEFKAPLPNSINVIMYMEFSIHFVHFQTAIISDVFYKDSYTGEIFEGALLFMKEQFEKETYMCVVN